MTNHTFSQIPRAEIQRSVFDRSHGVKTTFDADVLVPIFIDEALPGDTFNVKMSGFARLATPINPTMDNLYMESFFFAVPNRLVWENWEKFNGAQDSPGDSTDYTIPTQTAPAGGFAVGEVPDYMGVPTGVDNIVINSLPLRAYKLIFNEWFRDQNLIAAIDIPLGDTGDVGTTLSTRAKKHDYFSSALPFLQKGDPVSLPLGQSAPIVPDPADPTPLLKNAGSGNLPLIMNDTTNDQWTTDPTNTSASTAPADWAQSGLLADLTNATATTINDIRQAFQVQRLLERDARGGTRYTEIIRAHFNVVSPDARLQRPEFLGGGRSMVNIRQVEQTSSTDATTPQGNLAAYGTASFNGHGFNKSFTEHCFIIGLINVRADLTYQEGINRMWTRQTRYDFFWPALSHLGEQAIRNDEIFAGTNLTTNAQPWAYQERYAEYRYKPSVITGKFRSSDPETLDSWHYAQDFGTLPPFNSSFIRSDTPIDRTISVPTEPHFLFDGYFRMKCARPMPLYGVPGFVDHF